MAQSKGKILVTPRSLSAKGHPALEALTEAGYEIVYAAPGRQPSEQELLAVLPACVGFLAGVECISAAVLKAATKLKVISRNGTGIENIDPQAAAEMGIRICRAVGANARGVAELAMGLILSVVRSVPFSDAALKGQSWQRRKGIELDGRRLGLIGCGRIGKLLCGFALGFGMKVLACDLYPDVAFAPSPDFAYCELDRMLGEADVISLHCPPSRDGKPVIDASAIAAMTKGVYIVNTARGSLVDTDAMLAALESGQVSGLAVDAFEAEPPTDWRLATHSRVIATPHIGGFTEESVARASSVAVENLLASLGDG